jgi:hypothetical protein
MHACRDVRERVTTCRNRPVASNLDPTLRRSMQAPRLPSRPGSDVAFPQLRVTGA